VSARPNQSIALALWHSAADSEVHERLMTVLALLLWAQFATSEVQNPRRPVWMRTTSPRSRPLRRARASVTGRRARG